MGTKLPHTHVHIRTCTYTHPLACGFLCSRLAPAFSFREELGLRYSARETHCLKHTEYTLGLGPSSEALLLFEA